ncbi:hypothetical protein SHIRM173S_07673 [Streptomyces hirsutus]
MLHACQHAVHEGRPGPVGPAGRHRGDPHPPAHPGSGRDRQAHHLAVYDTYADWETGHAAHLALAGYEVRTVAPTGRLRSQCRRAARVRPRARRTAARGQRAADPHRSPSLGRGRRPRPSPAPPAPSSTPVCPSPPSAAPPPDSPARACSTSGRTPARLPPPGRDWLRGRRVEADAVTDGGLVTAGPTEPVAFAREIFRLLQHLHDEPAIDAWYRLFRDDFRPPGVRRVRGGPGPVSGNSRICSAAARSAPWRARTASSSRSPRNSPSRRTHRRPVAGARRGPPRTLPVSGIARVMGITRQSVQRIADLLVERGLAEYRPNPAHRRAKLLAVTERGRAAVGGIGPGHAAFAQRLAEAFGEAELAQAVQDIGTPVRGARRPRSACYGTVDDTQLTRTVPGLSSGCCSRRGKAAQQWRSTDRGTRRGTRALGTPAESARTGCARGSGPAAWGRSTSPAPTGDAPSPSSWCARNSPSRRSSGPASARRCRTPGRSAATGPRRAGTGRGHRGPGALGRHRIRRRAHLQQVVGHDHGALPERSASSRVSPKRIGYRVQVWRPDR